MTTKLTPAMQGIINDMNNGYSLSREESLRGNRFSWYLKNEADYKFKRANGMVISGMVKRGIIKIGQSNGLGHTPCELSASYAAYNAPKINSGDVPTYPAAAPTGQPQAVTPADAAALGVSERELDAALAAAAIQSARDPLAEV